MGNPEVYREVVQEIDPDGTSVITQRYKKETAREEAEVEDPQLQQVLVEHAQLQQVLVEEQAAAVEVEADLKRHQPRQRTKFQ